MTLRIIAVFLLQISASLFSLATNPTWTINKDILEQKLPVGVNVDDLTTVLKEEGIVVEYVSSTNNTLWEGNKISIEFSSTPFSPYHLWVSVNNKKTLDECTEEELVELYQGILTSKKAVSELTGADAFMIFITEQMRNGKQNASVGFEIIPSGFGGSQGVMDAVEKNALIKYVFYDQICMQKISYSQEDIDKLRQYLQSLQPTIQKEEVPAKTRSQKLSRHSEALHQSLESIHEYLSETGALVEGEMPPCPVKEDEIHEIHIDLDKCAFCNPKVIEKQLVCSWKDVQILMSHKPISPYGNFLILPKRHQSAWDLTQEEALASFEAIISLKRYFNKSENLNNWICYIQDGPAVGQTVMHTHIHFYILPHPLKSAISTLQHIHNQRPILSYEQMRSDCERIQPSLLDELYELDM